MVRREPPKLEQVEEPAGTRQGLQAALVTALVALLGHQGLAFTRGGEQTQWAQG